MKPFPSLAITALASAFAAQSVQAQAVLYSDTFTRTTGSGDANGNPAGAGNGASDWGTNDNGLGGLNSQSWVTTPSRTGGANQVTGVFPGNPGPGSRAYTLNGGAAYNFDAAAVSPLGFSVAFDFNRDADGDGQSANGYLGVGLGAPVTTASSDIGGGAFTISQTDFSILFQQAQGANTGGNTQFRTDTDVILNSPAGDGPVDYGNANAPHSVLLTFVPQIAGLYGDANVINGSLSIDGGSAFNFTTLGGADFGTLSFSSNTFVARAVDNVRVTSLAVPEPASLTLVALGGATLLGRRRRA